MPPTEVLRKIRDIIHLEDRDCQVTYQGQALDRGEVTLLVRETAKNSKDSKTKRKSIFRVQFSCL